MIDDQIRQLASFKETQSPFLSLYIDTTRTDEAQGERVRLFLKNEVQRIRENLEGNGQLADAIENGIRQIERYVQNDLDARTRGLAIFACPTDEVFIPLQLPVPVEPQLTIGSRPRIGPLAELRNDHPTLVLAMVDAKSARLFELELGRVLYELDMEDPDMPRRHDQGGWSQARLQRHVQDHIDRHHKEVAETLRRMVERDGTEGVILSGQERNVANFRQFLGRSVEERLYGTLHLDIRSSEDEILEACSELIRAHRATKMNERLGSLEEAARKNGRGALGVRAVTDAANQRKIEVLFIERGREIPGWKCMHCEIIGQQVPLGCPACGEPVLTVDLAEQFIAAAHTEDADVELVGSESMLSRYEGVGALLRF